MARTSDIETNLLEKLGWPDWGINEIAKELKESFYSDYVVQNEEKPEEDDDLQSIRSDNNSWIITPLSFIKAADKPKRIATRLRISVDKVYSLRRELRRQIRKRPLQLIFWPKRQEVRKENWIRLMAEFIRLHAHQFFTTSHLIRCLEDSRQVDKVPSTTTIRNWMRKDLSLSFKKVNLRFKSTWTSEDLVIKLKFLWIFKNFIDKNFWILYIDEFNIRNKSIKSYNWWLRGKSEYWFYNKKSAKFNCIIAVCTQGPVHIHIWEESIDAAKFASFLKETLDKLGITDDGANPDTVLIFDNAPIHTAKLVEKAISETKCWAITLPPYTPEWNDSEIVINIIKRKIDRDFKNKK